MSKNNIEAIYPLSPLQEGLLFHFLEQNSPGVYFQQYGCIYDGDVDGERLQRAWENAVKRYPVLRTFITWERRDTPLQVVRDHVTVPFQHLDWRAYSSDEQNRRWTSLLELDRDRGFDLTKAPLTRFSLIRLSDTKTRFLWSFHHIILDGWSQRMILGDVARMYEVDGDGDAAGLAPTPSYADFVKSLDAVSGPDAETFWRGSLKDFSTPTCPAPLNNDGLSSGKSGHATIQHRKLGKDVVAGLESLARRERLTLNALVLGAWTLVLNAHCQADDIVFGTTLSGRPAALDHVEKIAGLFINTLPLRVKVASETPLVEWLRGIQSSQQAMLSHEQTPLSAIQRWTDLKPGTPLFETIVVFENMPAEHESTDPGPLDKARDEDYIAYSNFPLAIIAMPLDGLKLMAVHDPARFSANDATGLLSHLEAVLVQMSRSLAGPVSNFSILPDTERALMFGDWNGTQADIPSEQCIHDLFENCVQKSPDAVAVVYEDISLTYAELNSRANRLAQYLQQQRCGAGQIVPLLFDRSADTIIALLAVLKTGAAYVQLDPALPNERLALMLADVLDGANGPVLSQSHLRDKLPDGMTALCLDSDWSDVANCLDVNPDRTATPDALAYIIYTSGSTGSPKGVMISHRALVNSTLARGVYYPEALTSYLLLSSTATDSSVAGIYWTLCTGAKLIIPKKRLEQDMVALSELIAGQSVSHILCVPSLYSFILEQCGPERLASLKVMLVAGEACPARLVADHYDILPDTALYNEYGPSEATVWASVAKLDQDSIKTGVTIGRPVPNMTLYILDNRMRPVPVGMAGELYIGGIGLADGYLNDPEKTAEKFVTNPFCPESGTRDEARLYKTGDRVRYRADGNIEFLGRVDHQIKIRGYRVEPEEIETILMQHPAVSEAVVFLEQADAEISDDVASLTKALAVRGTADGELLLSKIEGEAL